MIVSINNPAEFGLFGDIDAWSYCVVEEQGKSQA